MLLQILLASLCTIVKSVLGPDSLYQTLSPLTVIVESPTRTRYRIQPYTEVTQLGSQNLSCGTFQTYTSSNGLYTYHQYSGGSTDLNCSPRSFQLTLACNGGSSTVTLGPVTESPLCTYQGTLYTPQACGVNFAVGQETASMSETPTPTTTQTPSSTAMYFVTLFPTRSPSATITPSGTPLFMVTAWPTTSPLNVSPSSTPLYFMTAYPSYDPNNGTLAGGALSAQGGNTATILGGVAVAGVAAGGLAFIVKHFKNGGSLKGLITSALKHRSKLNSVIKDLPVSDSIKSKIMNPESLIPPSAKSLIAVAKSPHDLINNLPVPDELKAHLKRTVANESISEKITKLAEESRPAIVVDQAISVEADSKSTNIIINTSDTNKHLEDKPGEKLVDVKSI